MKKGIMVIIIGVIIIVASLAVGYYLMAQSSNEIAKNIKSIDVAPNSTKNITQTLEANTQYYLFLNSSTANVNYKLINPSGNVIENGTVGEGSTSSIKFTTTDKGTYTLELTNTGNTTATVGYLITSQSIVNSLLTAIGALGVCAVGVIVVIVGIVIAVKNRK